jgi:hypothetical protein
MSLQSIISMSETITFDRRKVLGIQYTRNEIPKINETVTRNPWKFEVTVSTMMVYQDVRSLLEEIDRLDRRYPEVVSFSPSTGASTGLGYMLAYQGDLASTQTNSITVQSFTGTTLVLNNLPSVSTATYIFKKGDFIQVANFPHPFTTIYDVQRGSDSSVTVTTHRPAFGSMNTATVGNTILVGNDVQFKVFCNNMPVYKFNPGGSSALVTWSGPFILYEYTGDI